MCAGDNRLSCEAWIHSPLGNWFIPPLTFKGDSPPAMEDLRTNRFSFFDSLKNAIIHIELVFHISESFSFENFCSCGEWKRASSTSLSVLLQDRHKIMIHTGRKKLKINVEDLMTRYTLEVRPMNKIVVCLTISSVIGCAETERNRQSKPEE